MNRIKSSITIVDGGGVQAGFQVLDRKELVRLWIFGG